MGLGHYYSSSVDGREGPTASPQKASRAIKERAVGIEGRKDCSIAGLHKPSERRLARRGWYRVRKCRRQSASVKGNISLMRPTVMHVGRRQLVAEVRDGVARPHSVDKRAGRESRPICFREALELVHAKSVSGPRDAQEALVMSGRGEMSLMAPELRPLPVSDG